MSKPRAARALVGSLALLVAAGCGGERAPGPAGPSAAGSSSSIAIVGVTVIHPGRDGAAAQERDRTVLVQGDRITAVGPAASTPPPAGARVIDGRGRWLIPEIGRAHV